MRRRFFSLCLLFLLSLFLLRCGDHPTGPITMPSTNRAPVADAGLDQTVWAWTVVTLDGSGSRDPDGDVVTYQWVQVSGPSGSSVGLTNADSVRARFTPTTAGTYVFEVRVSDGKTTGTDRVMITASQEIIVTLPGGATMEMVWIKLE